MPSMIIDAIAVLTACLVITAVIAGLVIFSPAKRRRRRRKRHSSRPRIDLSRPVAAEPVSEQDA